LTEISRRYYACAVALAKAMGVPMSETFLREHRESISCCFIEAGRAGVRLPSGVQLPPLAQAEPVADAPVASPNGHPVLAHQDRPPADPSTNGAVTAIGTGVPNPPVIATMADLPTRIPAGLQLPCADALISDLRPPQLSLLIGKVGLRAMTDKSLEPLHVALLAERARRFEQGRKTTGEG
jgi:hypothetical protein